MLNRNPDDDRRRDVALFRFAVLGDLIHLDLPHGTLKAALEAKASRTWRAPGGALVRYSAKAIEAWLTRYRRGGFDALRPRDRSDRHRPRSIPADLVELIVDMKRERPGRSAGQIVQALVDSGRVAAGMFSIASVQRLLAARGLSGPRMEIEVPARHKFRASAVNELWQVDAVHGPKLFDPAAGRATTVKVFGLLDDHSRLITYARGSFHERQEDFLRALLEAVRRRGIPRTLLLDNHGSFVGADVKVVCAQLGIRLVHARPYDGASKGKIERFWQTLRSQLLDELDSAHIPTLDDLNLRIMTWVDSRYNVRPHGGINGQTPLECFEAGADAIRYVEDYAWLTSTFVTYVQRKVRRDATVRLNGRIFEVPQHLRRQSVRLFYAVLQPGTIWIQDGDVQVFLREVDEIANSRRARVRDAAPNDAPPSTGVNAVEAMLQRGLRPGASQDLRARSNGDEEEGGPACVLS